MNVAGKVSWFGGPGDPSDSGHTADGGTTKEPGIAVYNHGTLGGYWRVKAPNGKTVVLKQTDIGPAPWTGRKIDVTYSALNKFGFNEHDFPTDSHFDAEYLGRTPPKESAAPVAPQIKLPGVPTVPKEVESLDKPAFEKARKASLVGKLLASEGGSSDNPLLLSGLATTKAPLASEYQTSKIVQVPQGQTVAEHNGNPIVKVTEGPKAGQTVYVPANVPNAKGGVGFTQAPGTTYNKGILPEIASRANKLAVALGIKLTGLSGGRTPAHSVAVGGFADDPHTKDEASDTPGIEQVPKATLNKYGLERPFPGTKEADHIQLLHSVNKNGGY